MTTFIKEQALNPFDILARDFFQSQIDFESAFNNKIKYPVDIYEDPQGLHFEVACVGLAKEDIELTIVDGDTIRIVYNKETTPSADRVYISKTIARRSFDLGYKISNKFNLKDLTAEMSNGALHIHAPYAEASKPKSISIK
jgi:HSP20 family molecular chaperone IbpA